ncbi:hypothetical protein COO91_03815 [Nostoc flagelliforme CCNUN1]|uniref:Uncharacterized protein n=1 Tax=Nostoc flagelliforme CCNUN1 TaxID=2038116 RepID=A0A2K8SRE3_9NOSO|nr:hypothetical protein COO91_03815 [Nostoc flagelliforme CCNUN1]
MNSGMLSNISITKLNYLSAASPTEPHYELQIILTLSL